MTLRDVLKNFDNKNFKVIEYRAIVPAGNSNEEIEIVII